MVHAIPVFSDHRLQRFFVQAQIRYQFPQPRVLLAQLLYFAFQAYSVCLDTPSSPATSSTARPASTCLRAAIICASVCLLRDMPLPLSFAKIILSCVRN